MAHKRRLTLIVAMVALWQVAALTAPATAAPAAGSITTVASTSGLARGDYRLSIAVRSTTGADVPGVIVQYAGGAGPALRVAVFNATPAGNTVRAGVRSNGLTDVFQVITFLPVAASPLTTGATTLGTVVRGTSFIGPNGAAQTWHGINTDPYVQVADIVGLHNTTAANLVRIPVSECMWLPWSASYVPTYRQRIIDLVNAVTSNGMTAIVNLHWACHDDTTWRQWNYNAYDQIGPDQHSITFWRDAAATFMNNRSVMFELFNEPQLQLELTYAGRKGADVWLNGGQLSYGGWTWQAPGMQQLYDTVRSTGADNVILADGLEWGSDLRMITSGYVIRGWNVGYAYHAYTHDGQNEGQHSPYLDTKVWPSIDPNGRWAYAGIVTEFGTAAQNVFLLQTATNYFNDTLSWLKARGQSWAVWGWYPHKSDPYALLAYRPSTVTNRGTAVLAAF